MRKHVILFIIVFSCMHGFISAQQVEKIQVLLDFPRSASETISKSRKVLFVRLAHRDTATVGELVDFLRTGIDGNKYITLFPEELKLFDYSLLRYRDVMDSSLRYDWAFVERLKKKQFPKYDDLLEGLVLLMRLRRQEVYEQIGNSEDLSPEEKDFLKLDFDQTLSLDADWEITMDSLNPRKRNFLQSYPDSKYLAYVKDFTGMEFKTRKFGGSFEFFSGFGTCKGDLDNYVTGIIPAGITFDLRFKHFAARIIDYIGFSKTKDTIKTAQATWRKNAPARVLIPGIVVGYYFVDREKVKLYPFIGASFTGIGPPLFQSGKKENQGVGFDLTYTKTFGVSMEFRLKSKHEKDLNIGNGDIPYIRFSYTLNQPQFQKKYPQYQGAIHTISIGYVFLLNPLRRMI